MATDPTETATTPLAAEADANLTAAEPQHDRRRPRTEVQEVSVAATAGHGLLQHQLGHDVTEPSVITTAGVSTSLALRLYVSHFLSTWNSRVFEFGAVLFLASIFPGTLLQVSIYSLVRNAGYIIFAQAVGSWINGGNRLTLIRASIVGQRLAVAVSCALLLVLLLKPEQWAFRKDDAIFAAIVFLAVVEKLCSTMNMISVERDWVGVYSFHRTSVLISLLTWCASGCCHHRG